MPRLARKLSTLLLSAFLLGASLTVAEPRPARAEEPVVDTYALIAVYILNFAKFTSWPEQSFPSPESGIILGIFGDDVFGDTIDTIAGKTVHDRPLIVHRLGLGGNPRDCHILYVAASERRRLHQILAAVAPLPVLTVSDMDDFAAAGGMIQLQKKAGRIHLLINLTAAQRAGITLRSGLLKIATIVAPRQ